MKTAHVQMMLIALLGASIPLYAAFAQSVPSTVLAGLLLLLVSWIAVQLRLWVLTSRLEKENDLLAARAAGDDSSEGLISNLEKVMDDLKGKGAAISSETVSRILTARIPHGQGHSSSLPLVLLGLLSLLAGFAEVLSGARSELIDGVTWVYIHRLTTLLYFNMLPLLAPVMTALALAVLVLLGESILRIRGNALIARAEEYVRFELLPRYASAEHEPLEHALEAVQKAADGFSISTRDAVLSVREDLSAKFSASLEKSLSSFSEQWNTGLQKLEESLANSRNSLAVELSKAGSELSQKALAEQERLITRVADAGQALVESQKSSVASLEESQKASAASLERSQRESLEALGEGLRTTLESKDEERAARLDAIAANLEPVSQFASSVSALQDEINSSLQFLGEKIRETAERTAEEQSVTLAKMTEQSLEEIRSGMSDITGQTLAGVKGSFGNIADSASRALEGLESVSGDANSRLEEQSVHLQTIMDTVEDASGLMKINQAELQASLEMFTQGVENLVESLSDRGGEQESRAGFYERLEATLEAFHEKASEVLVANSLQTQEILLDVLAQNKGGKKTVES